MQHKRTVILLLIWAFTLSIYAQKQKHSKDEIEAALIELDSAITHKKTYQAIRLARADSLEKVANSCHIDAYISKCKELYEVMADYDGRRALKVLNRIEETPEYQSDVNLNAWVNLNRSRTYGIMGIYNTALGITGATKPERLSTEEQIHYYQVCQSNYKMIVDYMSDISVVPDEERQMTAYFDSILALLPKGLERSVTLAQKEVYLGHPQKAWDAIQEQAKQAKGKEADILHPVMAHIYELLDENQEHIYYLTLCSINDLKSGTTIYEALPQLVLELYNAGDIDRAYNYLTCLMEDANVYPSRSLALDVSRYFPLINTSYSSHREFLMRADKERRNSILITFAFLALSLGVAFYLGWRQNAAAAEKKRADELQKALDQATVADRVKTVFIQNMRHEIRTPLNSIVGFAQLLSNDLSDEERALYNNYIQESNDKLLSTLDAIIDVSDMEVGTFHFKFEDFDVDQLCKETIEMTRAQLPTGVTFAYKPQKAGLHLNTDRKRIGQALYNLLSNACKHTVQGTITLSTAHIEDNDSIEFSVTDTGIGIPAEKAGVIFEHFEKLDHYSPGLGLGLYICQLITRALGGDIHLDTSYTEGARFIFSVQNRHDA